MLGAWIAGGAVLVIAIGYGFMRAGGFSRWKDDRAPDHIAEQFRDK